MKYKAKEFVTIKTPAGMLTLEEGQTVELSESRYLLHPKLEVVKETAKPIKEKEVEEVKEVTKKQPTKKKVNKK